MQRYLPPHQRGKAVNGSAAAELRALDHQTHASQVRLVAPSEAEFDPADCPLDLEEASNEPQGSKVYTIYFPEKMPEELLAWFKKTFGECSARLEFPTELSKLERAKWHSSAHRKGLPTESRGVGDDRFLSIASQALAEEGEGGELATSVKLNLNRAQRHRAQQIYDFCQLEGGRFWDYSKGELEELVASGQPLPEDLAEMVDRRERGARVSQLLRAGEPAEALQMLVDNPKLAWQKDEYSGGYPIHIATFKGYRTVVEYLASLPNVIEQRDGMRETPLAIAMRRGNAEMERLLLDAGADVSHANFHRDPLLPAAAGAAGHHSGSEEDKEPRAVKPEEEEYVSWNRAERRAYKHGGEGGPGRRRSVDNGRRSIDNGSGSRRTSIDGKAAAQTGSRRRSVDFPTTNSHCPW